MVCPELSSIPPMIPYPLPPPGHCSSVVSSVNSVSRTFPKPLASFLLSPELLQFRAPSSWNEVSQASHSSFLSLLQVNVTLVPRNPHKLLHTPGQTHIQPVFPALLLITNSTDPPCSQHWTICIQILDALTIMSLTMVHLQPGTPFQCSNSFFRS
jgi:hypothetical protein